MEGYEHFINIDPKTGALYITCVNLLNNGQKVIVLPVMCPRTRYITYAVWIKKEDGK